MIPADEFRHFDLFSGIGGFATAARMAGRIRTIAFSEIEPYASAVLAEKFSGVPNLGDIFGINAGSIEGRIDIITGGFPCQPFSIAGKRRGASDHRALWPQMLRVIEVFRPAWVIGENVAGIITMELDRVLSDLEGIGYACRSFVIPACSVDAKHRRDRVWIIANSDGGRCAVVGESKHGEQQRARRDQSDGFCQGRSRPRPDVFDTDSEGREHAGESLARRKIAREGKRNDATASRASGRDAKPVVCGMVDGISDGLDAPCTWVPEDEATPRVDTGIKNRAARLRGLGNAIVPQVAAEILRAIVTLEFPPE